MHNKKSSPTTIVAAALQDVANQIENELRSGTRSNMIDAEDVAEILRRASERIKARMRVLPADGSRP